MSYDKIALDAGVYTNLQSLQSLHYDYKNHPDAVKKEVAQQFESLLVQMLLKSMRATNKEFSGDLMHSDQSDLYEDLYDKQLAMVLSKSGIGIAKTIEDYIDKSQAQTNRLSTPDPIDLSALTNQVEKTTMPIADFNSSSTGVVQTLDLKQNVDPSFENTLDFVNTLWGSAKEAAHILGVDPKILLAQAALETNWGKNIIPQGDGGSSHNLFNIKADSSWNEKTTAFNTIEQRDHVLVKEKAKFRAYDSYLDSFIDYADFLKQNSRYNKALENVADPKKFVQSLQNANYATDTAYSEKIMDIFSSKKFNQLFDHLI